MIFLQVRPTAFKSSVTASIKLLSQILSTTSIAGLTLPGTKYLSTTGKTIGRAKVRTLMGRNKHSLIRGRKGKKEEKKSDAKATTHHLSKAD